MYKVLKQVKRSFAVFSALFITVITSRVRGQQNCGPEKFAKCYEPLSVVTDSGLTFVSSKADLDRLCPDLKANVRCVHAYSKNCMNPTEHTHFKELFHGAGFMVHELCRNGTYQREFLKHAPCMKQAEDTNGVCFKRYADQMTEISTRGNLQNENISSNADMMVSYQKKKREAANEGIKSVCCVFQEYVECSTHTMRRACGEEAERFSRNFLHKMSSPLLKKHCAEYGRRECGLISSTNTIQSSTTLILFSLLAFLGFFIS